MIPKVFLNLDAPHKARRRHVVLHGCFKLLKNVQSSEATLRSERLF
jgi:hypothetical protein